MVTMPHMVLLIPTVNQSQPLFVTNRLLQKGQHVTLRLVEDIVAPTSTSWLVCSGGSQLSCWKDTPSSLLEKPIWIETKDSIANTTNTTLPIRVCKLPQWWVF